MHIRKKIPKVSICIPTYNQGKFIRETIESAINQDFDDYEIVISNNQCTDDTDLIVRSFQSNKIKYIVQPRHLPIMTQNWNACVKASNGKYVCLLSSDDVLNPNFLYEQVHLLEKYPKVAFAHSAVELIDEQGKTIGLEKSIHPSFVRDGTKEFLRYIWGPKCVLVSVLFRRDLFNIVGGFDERYHIVGDWALWLKLLKYGGVAYNEKVLAKYRVYTTSARGSSKEKIMHCKERFKLLDETFSNWPKHVPYNDKLREKVMRSFALSTLTAAVEVSDQSERKLLISLALSKSNSFRVRLKANLINQGFGPVISFTNKAKWHLRQWVKKILYP
ncbi:MAG TPA: glycosyltransferase [Candidatus Desulfofervidus auxilii]|uniref:Glycosyltransferase n=1 Tax=Desulfofervidus auxilii TaxID=1621989 RepID=A0A7C2AD13_DESA2|nr:glycosyltransferase [Candidatus Desulfofervidus auxilii]